MKTTLLITGLLILADFLIKQPAYSQEVYKMTVAPDGSGDFTSIQKAIDACKSFPDLRVTIFVKNGIYKEKIIVPACNTN